MKLNPNRTKIKIKNKQTKITVKTMKRKKSLSKKGRNVHKNVTLQHIYLL